MLRKLEKYDILEEIGHGGMATVYRARDEHLDREVAIKVLHPHLQAAAEARSRFEREARSVAKLRHPNVLEIYDYSGAESEESYISAELLSGPTLKHFAEAHSDMPAEIAACFAIQIARALRAAHEQGIIHRDVKPENVLLHDNRCIKLTDFGIAQLLDAQSFTATGQVLGSPGHMAPEQVEGRDCDARSDLFSLGTVLYYLAAGRLPFRGRNPHQVLKRIVEGDYPSPLRVRPTMGTSLAGIIDKALAGDPDARYQSAEELEGELMAFLAEVGIDDPDEELASYLADPDGQARRLRATVVERLTLRGEEAAARGDFRAALDAFDRVLALDEGNERVLARVEKLRRRGDRRRQAFIGSGVALGLAGVVAMVAALRGASDTRPPSGAEDASETSATPGAMTAQDGIVSDSGSPGGDGIENDTAPSEEPSAVATEDAGTEAEEASTEPPGREAARPRSPTRGVRRNEPRTVVFQPSPQNVLIRIDGGEARAFGPSFHRTELAPGRHTFVFESGADCCGDVEFQRRIPPGPGTTVVSKQLPVRPAGLYVISNAPGDVEVGDGLARGRTREVLRVPMEGDVERVVRIAVTASQHDDYTGAVRLRAGQVVETHVRLEPAEGASR